MSKVRGINADWQPIVHAHFVGNERSSAIVSRHAAIVCDLATQLATMKSIDSRRRRHKDRQHSMRDQEAQT